VVQRRRPQPHDRFAFAGVQIRTLLESKMLNIANRMQHDRAHKSGIVRVRMQR